MTLDSVTEIRVLCARSGPCGRSGQENQISFGRSPLCPQGSRRPAV